jgi:glycosyltransferase involved in cell wall biosynthesis
MMQPKVTVLMVTYNRPETIGRAIASVREQTLGEWELIIVQDGSNSNTGRLLGDWLEKDQRIRHFRRGTVGSIAEASNFGLAAARGDYVAILDDDDYWIDRLKLERQVEFLDGNPEYVGCGGGYAVLDRNDRLRGKFLKPEQDAAIRERALLANPVANSTAMFRRVVRGEPVAYDLSMRQFADWDFWLTMGARGKLYNFPFHLAHYMLWEGGSSFRRQRENARAALRIIRKHRREYRGFLPALLLAGLYFGYACLPESVRQASYASLSALKKGLAGGRGGIGVQYRK